jgi:hypothetical protein
LQGNHNIDLTAALAPAPAASSTGIWQHVGREAARPVAVAAAAKKQPAPPPEHEPSFVEQVAIPASRTNFSKTSRTRSHLSAPAVALGMASLSHVCISHPRQVADFAARNSVVFLPKPDGHTVGGKRVYTFGKHSV